MDSIGPLSVFLSLVRSLARSSSLSLFLSPLFLFTPQTIWLQIWFLFSFRFDVFIIRINWKSPQTTDNHTNSMMMMMLLFSFFHSFRFFFVQHSINRKTLQQIEMAIFPNTHTFSWFPSFSNCCTLHWKMEIIWIKFAFKKKLFYTFVGLGNVDAMFFKSY